MSSALFAVLKLVDNREFERVCRIAVAFEKVSIRHFAKLPICQADKVLKSQSLRKIPVFFAVCRANQFVQASPFIANIAL
ncbi:MAG: hypothetical protein LBR13_03215 [Dysgonamonadaceae bacterium]|nr:hypothetical protein [Dysgonamonadaceae bacterium]